MVRDQVFISYSHQDERFLTDLRTHLKPYLQKGAFTVWSDKQIEPGSEWFGKIKAALAKTSVAVMLVSPDFLASDFIHDHELSQLLKDAAADGVRILWVLIRDCSYKETPLSNFQAVVSPPGKPFASMTKAKRDTAWRKVCETVKQAVNHLLLAGSSDPTGSTPVSQQEKVSGDPKPVIGNKAQVLDKAKLNEQASTDHPIEQDRAPKRKRPPVFHVFQIGEFKTLPLYYLQATTAEEIPAFSKGKANIIYQDPEYARELYDLSPEWLRCIGTDAAAAIKMVKRWPHHIASYKYYVQFRDDPTRQKVRSLHDHTALISALCDSRLGIDTKELWSAFNELQSFEAIHSQYREDAEREKKYEQYAERLAKVREKTPFDLLSASRLIERIVRQIEFKAAVWAKLPPIHSDASEESAGTKVICPLHGIRTHAAWQRGLSDLLGSRGWICRLDRWSYGRFSLLAFFTPWTREGKLGWFREQYDAEIHDRRLDIEQGQIPSVVAHSFGTFILGYTLLRFDFIRVNKVILCGSILPTDFPWDRLIDRGQVQAVRNEYGVRDPWVKRASWFVRGAGSSGSSGFTHAHERLEQEEFDYDHGEYFGKDHMEDRWLPFLSRPLAVIPRSKGNTRIERPDTSAPWGLYGLLLTAFFVAVALLISLWVR